MFVIKKLRCLVAVQILPTNLQFISLEMLIIKIDQGR